MKRVEAAQRGLAKYTVAKRCSRGHEPIRYTSNGMCVACSSIHVRGYNKRLTKQSQMTINGIRELTGVFIAAARYDEFIAVADAMNKMDGAKFETVAHIAGELPMRIPEPVDLKFILCGPYLYQWGGAVVGWVSLGITQHVIANDPSLGAGALLRFDMLPPHVDQLP